MSDILHQKAIFICDLDVISRDVLSSSLVNKLLDDLHDSIWESVRLSLRHSLYSSLSND